MQKNMLEEARDQMVAAMDQIDRTVKQMRERVH